MLTVNWPLNWPTSWVGKGGGSWRRKQFVFRSMFQNLNRKSMLAVLPSDINSLISGLLHLTGKPYCKKTRFSKSQRWNYKLNSKELFRWSTQTTHWWNCSKEIQKGEVSLYRRPPIWLVWSQLFDYWQFLFLFAKQTNPNQSNRYSDTSPFRIPCCSYHAPPPVGSPPPLPLHLGL